jgi:uncharacterized integral membrane protein
MKVKLVISIVLTAIATVFVSQNTEVVQVNFLTWSVVISLALLVFFALGTGLVIGWLLSSYLRFARNRKRLKEEAGTQTEGAVAQTDSSSSIQEEKQANES